MLQRFTLCLAWRASNQAASKLPVSTTESPAEGAEAASRIRAKRIASEGRGQVLPVARFSRCWASGSRLPRWPCLMPCVQTEPTKTIARASCHPASQRPRNRSVLIPAGASRRPTNASYTATQRRCAKQPLRAGASCEEVAWQGYGRTKHSKAARAVSEGGLGLDSCAELGYVARMKLRFTVQRQLARPDPASQLSQDKLILNTPSV